MYQLKPGQETFQVIDGPLAGTTYHRGRRYAEIPDVEKHRFEVVKKTGVDSKSISPGGQTESVNGDHGSQTEKVETDLKSARNRGQNDENVAYGPQTKGKVK